MTDEVNELIRSNTLVDRPRLDIIRLLLNETKDLSGIVAEVGVYKGGTARWICEHTKKRVLLFDTFEGMPQTNIHDNHHKKSDFSDTSVSHVQLVLDECNNYAIYKGIFPRQNREHIGNTKFSLVHLDVDIYTSVWECLAYFEPRMFKKGIIILDDYNEPNCLGAKKAADEFVANIGLKIEPTVQSQAIIRIL